MRVTDPETIMRYIRSNSLSTIRVLDELGKAQWDHTVLKTDRHNNPVDSVHTLTVGQERANDKMAVSNFMLRKATNAAGEYERFCYNVGSATSPIWRVLAAEVETDEPDDQWQFVLTTDWMPN